MQVYSVQYQSTVLKKRVGCTKTTWGNSWLGNRNYERYQDISRSERRKVGNPRDSPVTWVTTFAALGALSFPSSGFYFDFQTMVSCEIIVLVLSRGEKSPACDFSGPCIFYAGRATESQVVLLTYRTTKIILNDSYGCLLILLGILTRMFCTLTMLSILTCQIY